MTALDDKLAKLLAENPDELHGLIRRSIEQERLFEMLGCAALDATDGASEWEGSEPDWSDIQAKNFEGAEDYWLDAMHLGRNFWAICNLLEIPEDQVRAACIRYYEKNKRALP